jgi:hypothetical protein
MCLTGGSPGYTYKEPVKKVWESEYEGPPPNTVNDKIIGEGGDYSQEGTKNEQTKRGKLKPKPPTKQSDKIAT